MLPKQNKAPLSPPKKTNARAKQERSPTPPIESIDSEHPSESPSEHHSEHCDTDTDGPHSQLAKKQRHQANLTTGEQLSMVEFLKVHPILYNKKLDDYENKKKAAYGKGKLT